MQSINGRVPFVNAFRFRLLARWGEPDENAHYVSRRTPLRVPLLLMDDRAILVASAGVRPEGGCYVVLVNERPLLTPAGHTVETASQELASALAAELEADGVADVTAPSLYAFFSTQRDFIEPRPERTIDALVELLAHDYLLHPDERLGVRQAQAAAWRPQIELWERLAGREPPYAPPLGGPDIDRSSYAAFRAELGRFTAAQLTIAVQAANLLKSATLGMLLARREIAVEPALDAASATLRLTAGDTQEDLEQQEEREDLWRETIHRLLRYAALTENR